MADWIILDKTTGIGSDEVTITVSSYSELVERLKNLVFTTTDNKASDTCVVRQFGKSRYLLVEPSTVIASYTGGEVEVRVIASEAWTIGNLPSWASCNATGGGAGTKTVRFTVEPNTGDIRKWNVYFLATEGLEAILELKQTKYGQSGYLEVNPSSINMVYGGGYVDVTVSSTEDWTIGNLPSWITTNTTGGTKGDTVIRLTISANTATSDRSYNISFTSANYNATLSVTQAKYEEGGIVPPEINLDNCEGGTFTVRITGGGCWSFEKSIPRPICDNALMWGEDRVAADRKMKVKINGIDYSVTQEGNGKYPGKWALCNYTGGTITSLEKMFYEDQTNMLRSVAFKENFDTSNVTSMSRMFDNNQGANHQGGERVLLHSLDLSMFNTSNVTDMSYLFRLCCYLPFVKADGWDTSNVVSMAHMFDSCNANIDLSGWNTSKVRNMSYMFSYTHYIAASNGSIGPLPAAELPRQRNIEGWDVSNVEDFSYMFYMNEIKNDYDLTRWNPAKVKTMESMFSKSKTKALNMSGWNLPEVLTIENMFYMSEYLTTLNLYGWKMPKVKTIKYAFYYLRSMDRLDVRDWKLPLCTDFSHAFESMRAKELDCTGWDTSGAETMSYMFSDISYLTSLDLSSFNTENVKDFSYMFYLDNWLLTLDLSNFKITENAGTVYMFRGCNYLNEVKVINCDSYTQNKILENLRYDISGTWTLGNDGIIRRS